MSVSIRARSLMLVVLASAALTIGGCSRAKYRLQADYDAYELIGERNADPRWQANDYTIDLDPRSRFFDSYDPDRSPMPQDDPASHQYMEVVDGMKGWKHWYDNGERLDLENPAWRESLSDYVNVEEDGALKLDIDTAVRLAYLHSPSHQNQLETLYLSALDVSAERFRLDTQFFGGYDARYAHNGSLIPPALRFDPVVGRFVINPAIDGVENNRLTLGRPFGASPVFSMERRFATAGEILVGFANSFVFEFTGGDANLSTSLANFSVIQPLLRGAGKDIALEQLTFVERGLLSNLRAYSQFRQGFYTQVAIGELGVSGPQRAGADTILQSFGGEGFVGGYTGLLQQLQQIRNSEDNLSLQLRTLERLEAFLDVGLIDLVQVEQFRQSVEDQRANLLLNRNFFELALDRYKSNTLGLPPDQPIALDDGLIRQFQLIPRKATAVQNSIVDLQDIVGNLPDDVDFESIREVIARLQTIVEPVRQQLEDTRVDLAGMDQAAPSRERTMTQIGIEAFKQDRMKLESTLVDLDARLMAATTSLNVLQEGLPQQDRNAIARRLVVWLNNLSRVVERSILVQARARLEAVAVERVKLQPRDAFDIALANRLDFMNGRAALVDSWRLIQFNADALQSVVNVTAGGELRTARNNPFSFRAPTGSVRLGLEVDAPFTRLLERKRVSRIAHRLPKKSPPVHPITRLAPSGTSRAASTSGATSHEPRNSTTGRRDRDSTCRSYSSGAGGTASASAARSARRTVRPHGGPPAAGSPIRPTDDAGQLHERLAKLLRNPNAAVARIGCDGTG